MVGHGVNPALCQSEPPQLPQQRIASLLGTARAFTFLYQGGALWRKGLDILLAAYGSAFSGAWGPWGQGIAALSLPCK